MITETDHVSWHVDAREYASGGRGVLRIGTSGRRDDASYAFPTHAQRIDVPNLANAAASSSLRFGGQYGVTTNRFGGQIDAVWMFNSVLSPSYVNALYTAASPCAPVAVTLAVPGSNAVYEAPATIDFVVLASSQNGVITQYDYYDGGAFIGTRQPGVGFSLSNLPPGTHTFTVKATDSTGANATSSPVTVTVVALTGSSTAGVATPANGGTFYTSGTVHLGATAVPASSYAIVEVQFWANGQEIGWTTTPPYDFTWRDPTPGTYTITVKVVDDAGYVTTSAPITITVVVGAPSVTYYYNDIAGTPIAATDATGNVVWNETYEPYGARYSHEDTGTQNGIWYTGKPVEDATGLSYYGGRWYNPAIGRFYSTDPQRFKEKNPLSFNRYAYGNNNPYRFVDPDGRDWG
ncbi:MAG: RHS repeat-associated core domain-containing protein [bacterium]